MANEPDGAGGADNLEVIRKLLQKLEEAASVDGGRTADRRPLAAAEPPPAVKPISDPASQHATPQRATRQQAGSQQGHATRELATLQRSRVPAQALPSIPLELSIRDPHLSPVETAKHATEVTAGQADTLRLGPTSTAVARSRPARRRSPAVAALSFALGAATAATIAIYFEPLKQLLPGATTPRSGATGIETTRAPQAVETPAVPITVAEAEPSSPGEAQSAAQPSVPAPSAAADTATVQAPSSPPVAVPNAPAPSPKVQPAEPATTTLSIARQLDGLAGDGAPFPLRLEPLPREGDAQLVVLRGVPEWLSLSKGSALGNEIWLVPAHFCTDLVFYVADGIEGVAPIKVELAMLDGRVLASAATTIKARRPAAPAYASAPIASTTASPARLADDVIVRLLARADLLLDTGDFSTARDLYKTAAEAGNAGGALKLGETYDPAELQRLGMTTNQADETAARRWYELAQSLGSIQAADRLTALRQR